MANEKKYSIGLFYQDVQSGVILCKVLRSFQIRDGRPYLNAWTCNKWDNWWKHYKKAEVALASAKKIIENCRQVVAIFTFDAESKKTVECLYREEKEIRWCREEELKKFLHEKHGIKFIGFTD